MESVAEGAGCHGQGHARDDGPCPEGGAKSHAPLGVCVLERHARNREEPNQSRGVVRFAGQSRRPPLRRQPRHLLPQR